MIRILSREEHAQGKKIWDTYLFLAALILPFSPEDVLDGDEPEVGGEKITAANFCRKAEKTPRRRNQNYTALLAAHGLRDVSFSEAGRFENDRFLAARIIENASRELYDFLYRPSPGSGNPQINRQNLRRLLTVRMDRREGVLEALPVIDGRANTELLDHVFRYKTFAAHPQAVRLAKYMDVSICPYCNRQYTTAWDSDTGSARPQFDHFLPKSRYPYFAVSLMNLIPSCALCNQVKGDKEKDILYPYRDEMGTDIVFRTKMKGGIHYLMGVRGAEEEFQVVLERRDEKTDEALWKRAENADRLFHLTEFYNTHKEYILHLFWKNYVFSQDYVEELCRQFPEMFPSPEDVKSFLYLQDIRREQWGRHSLGKLTHDIDQEIHGG